MRKSIATVSLSGTLEEKLVAAAHAGFDAVEIFEPDLIASPLAPADVRRRATDLGLGLELYQPFRDFETRSQDEFASNLRRAEFKFDVMEQLGSETMLVCSSVSPNTVDDDALAAEQLHELAARAARRGMRIAYEALAWGRRVNDYRHAWRIVAAGDHPHLGVCLDSFHILSRQDDPQGIREIPGDRIFFLQLADAPNLSMDVLQWSRHYRCFPGQGGFDLAGFMSHVVAGGYDGVVSLEVFNDVFRAADPNRMAVDAMRSLLVLEDSLAPRLPATPALRGYAFVELGMDPDSVPEAEGLLEALGFIHTSQHRSKPVQLWEQEAIRILLNRGERSADPRVAALAVESADPAGSAERAKSLLAPMLSRWHRPDEADLLAVAAPDGTSVFFCRTDAGNRASWLGDFIRVDEPATSVPGLTRVDHVALSHPFDSFDEAALFYRSVLGLRPQASLEVASPEGLVRSRAVKDPDGGIRLVLNVPLMAGGNQAELQHIAFACDDIFATARGLLDRRAPLLAISGNYYDDLAARTDLDPALIEDMRALRILYDRDAGGELFHCFTAMLGPRLFFEVLERRGAYDGYGHGNSAVRMVAHRTPSRTSAS